MERLTTTTVDRQAADAAAATGTGTPTRQDPLAVQQLSDPMVDPLSGSDLSAVTPAVQATEGEGQMASFVNTGVADAFMANPEGYCEGLGSEDMEWVNQQVREIERLVQEAGWETERERGDQANLDVFAPLNEFINGFMSVYPPSVEQRQSQRGDCSATPHPDLPGQTIPISSGDQYECLESASADYAQTVQNSPAILQAIASQLSTDTLSVLSDASAWDLMSDQGGGIGRFLGRIGIPRGERQVHSYEIKCMGGRNAGLDTGTPVIQLGVRGQTVTYQIDYSGPRGSWSVRTSCIEAGGGASVSASPDLPLSANIIVPSDQVLDTVDSAYYYGPDNFTGIELVSEIGVSGQALGGMAASTEDRIISFVNGMTFRIQNSGHLQAPSTIGTDLVSSGVEGSGAFGICEGGMHGRREGPEPIEQVERSSGGGAWLPFFQTVVGFETGDATIDDGDFEAIADTLGSLVDGRMSRLHGTEGLSFRLEIVGNASGRHGAAGSPGEADTLNGQLSQDRASAVWEELSYLIDQESDLFDMNTSEIPTSGAGSMWAESELGSDYQSNNDTRYRTAEIIVWVRVCG